MDRNRVLLQNLGVSDNQNVFLGLNNVEIAQISSYVNMSNVNTRDLSLLETTLTNASYLVNNRLTLADAAVYLGIYENKDLVTELQSEKYSNLKRWFNHVQFLCIPNNNSLQKVNLNFAPTLIPVSFGPSGAAEGKKADNKVEKKATEGKAVANKDGESKEKVKKEEKKVEAKKEEKAADDDEALDPSKLDFRVGLIVKCWLHPEAEKLLCEEIDLGESTGPRTICSGIRAHYNPDDIVGRKVLVLANLKDRTMVGVKSQGMVICACNADHSVVKLLDIPENAKVGERVTFNGFKGEPANSSQVAKKKILEKLAPGLRTDENGVVHWTTIPFNVAGSELIKAPLPNASVS